MENRLNKKFFIPAILSTCLMIYLGLWVSYEVLNIYSAKIKRRNQLSRLLKSTIQQIFAGDRVIDEKEEKQLNDKAEKIISETPLHYIRIIGEKGVYSILGRDGLKAEAPGMEGDSYEDGTITVWQSFLVKDGVKRTIPKKIKIVVSLDANEYFRDLNSYGKMLLLILIMGMVCSVLAIISWYVYLNNLNLKSSLATELDRKDQIEDISLAAAGLAHETKNPLGIIRGLAQQIASGKLEDEQVRIMAEDIVEEADVTTARLGDFLNYAKIRKPELKGVYASEHLNRMISLVNDDFENAGIELISEVEDIKILCDPDMLSQVTLNLLTNALKFTGKGGMVTLRLKNAGDKARLSVDDNGSGISEEMLPNIFRPYVSKNSEGYGIGMAIVKKIAEQSGWKIDVKSDKTGTSVIIENIKVDN